MRAQPRKTFGLVLPRKALGGSALPALRYVGLYALRALAPEVPPKLKPIALGGFRSHRRKSCTTQNQLQMPDVDRLNAERRSEV